MPTHIKAKNNDAYAFPMHSRQMGMDKQALSYDGSGRSSVSEKDACKVQKNPFKTTAPYGGGSKNGGY